MKKYSSSSNKWFYISMIFYIFRYEFYYRIYKLPLAANPLYKRGN